MMVRQQNLMANFQLHNLREMLEKLNRSEELEELSELLQFRLATQGISCLSITPCDASVPLTPDNLGSIVLNCQLGS
jgi:hypothetical protein